MLGYEPQDNAARIRAMSYEVLARKLRPAGFQALVGQDHVVRALQHGLDHDRLHHAYLFTGTRGVGKTTIARILAKALNCEKGISSKPCEQCSVCTQVKENRFVDLIEVDAASRTGVDDTRDLLENAQYLPTVGRYKVYLIDEVHMLSTQSFNALLKTLEEPPEHVKFLLATTEPKKVPVTVLSRCLQFQLKSLSKETIAEYLTGVLNDEGVSFEGEALEVIARCAAGSMRDALSLTDQAIAYGQGALTEDDVIAMLGIVGRLEVDEILQQLAAGDVHQLMATTSKLAEKNADFEDILKALAEQLHQLAIDLALGERKPGAPAFDEEEVQLYYQLALHGQRDLDLAPEHRSGFEMTLLRMLTFAPSADSPVAPRLRGDPGKKLETAPQPSTLERAGAGADDLNWYELVMQLGIGGVTKMIVENCVPESVALPNLHLVLDAAHETLLSEAQQQQIQRALVEKLGQDVVVSITLGQPQMETPSRRTARLAAERQQAAEQEINSDPNVAKLMSDFDARVVEIKPN